MRYSLSIGVISVLALVGCTQPAPPAPPDTRAADEKALKDDEVAWNKDWESKDVEKIIGHYSDDAELEIPDMQVLKTKDNMRNAIKQIESDPNWSIRFESDKVEVSKSGDLGYVQGHYTVTETDPKTKKKVMEKGKYVTIYKKQGDGTWKAVQDINNEDATPAP